jgi:methylenetetrahydrofolate reductase (NADPH)
MAVDNFAVISEIEPPTTPDLRHARHQIGVLAPVSDSFLIPDNHLGRATVSSVAVAHEVQAMGGTCVACINARDRNLLGFQRDLLTAAAYGVERFLFVGGDKPTAGAASGDLTVRTMIDEARASTDSPGFRDVGPFSVGVAASSARKLPRWKAAADFAFVQVSYSVDELVRWREENPVDMPVYAGVMVLASAGMARRLAASVPDIAIPDDLVRAVEADPYAGVEAACEQVLALRETGAFAGVHLVPVSRFRQVGARLESLLGR